MAPSYIHHLTLDPTITLPPTRDHQDHSHASTTDLLPSSLPAPKTSHHHPAGQTSSENASLYFVGTATTILEWAGIRLMTDPNFLHKGDHVHLGPGVTGTRVTDPAVNLEKLPAVDLVLLSHYHADHFDEKVEESLRRDLPIITTPHAKSHLASKPGINEAFTAVYPLNTFESMLVDVKSTSEQQSSSGGTVAALKVTAMPGKHVPQGILGTLNDLVKAVPPVNGWMLELGSVNRNSEESFQSSYRIYISGDTLMVDELKEIPERYKGQNIDLMLAHLGGTTMPSVQVPLLMVTMDAKQGIELVRLINPDVTIPIHYDDYDLFLSPLSDFKKAVDKAGLSDKVVYLERGDDYKFTVKSD